MPVRTTEDRRYAEPDEVREFPHGEVELTGWATPGSVE
jgi:hypothetical protein